MTALQERDWPVRDPKASVGIVHGLAEHAGRYEHVAAALNDAGYSVRGLDLPGHGQSPGFPGEMGGLDAAIEEVAAFAVRVAADGPKAFLLAHSMGTLLSLPAVAQVPSGTLAGLVLSGTAILPGPAVLESLATGGGLPPEALSRDPEVVEAYRNDPLVFYDRVPPEVMALAAEATQRASEAIAKIAVPVLLLHGVEDALCSIEGANHAHAELVVTDKTLRAYPGLYHEVLNEPEKDQVLKDLIGWLDEH